MPRDDWHIWPADDEPEEPDGWGDLEDDPEARALWRATRDEEAYDHAAAMGEI